MDEQEHLIYAIDLGSKTISLVIAKYAEKNVFGLNVLAMQSTASKGIRRGCIDDEGEVSRIVNALIQIAEKNIKKTSQTKRFYCLSVSGLAIDTDNSQYKITKASQSAVNDLDINRLKELALSKCYCGPDKSIIRATPISYDTDSVSDVASPRDYSSTNLTGRFLFTFVQNKSKETLNKIIKTSDEVDLFALGSAKARVLVTSEDLRNGVMLLDLGAQTTNIAIYYNDRLQSEASVPFGSDLITNDLSKTLKIPVQTAEIYKHNLGMATSLANDIDIDGHQLNIELYKLTVRARLEEILAYVDSEIEKAKCWRYIKKIIITGGGAKLKDIEDYITKFYQITAIKAKTNYETPDEEVQQFAGALGIAALFARENKDKLIKQGTLFPTEPQPDESEPTKEGNDGKGKKSFWGRLGDMLTDNDADKTF